MKVCVGCLKSISNKSKGLRSKRRKSSCGPFLVKCFSSFPGSINCGAWAQHAGTFINTDIFLGKSCLDQLNFCFVMF